MKKWFTYLVLALMMLSLVVAQGEIVPEPKINTGADGKANVRLNRPFAAIVGDFVCSDLPDYQWRKDHGNEPYIKKTDSGKLCYTNRRDRPIIWMVYNWDPWNLLDRLEILPGKELCVYNIDKGTKLDYTIYYCDERQGFCQMSDWIPRGCDNQFCDDDEIKIERIIVTEVFPNSCKNELLFSCTDQDNHKTSDGKAYDCSGGTTVPPVVDPPKPNGGGTPNLKGEWNNVAIPPVVKPNEDFEVRATFTALSDGKYLLEVGMLEQKWPLAIAVPSGSACDGDIHWAGQTFDLKKDQRIDLVFSPRAHTEEGTYSVVVGAYTGCLNAGGEKITVSSSAVKVKTDAVDDDTMMDVVLAFLLFFGGVIVAIVGIVYLLVTGDPFGLIPIGIGIIWTVMVVI